jgi:hypothetical protein
MMEYSKPLYHRCRAVSVLKGNLQEFGFIVPRILKPTLNATGSFHTSGEVQARILID